MSPDPPPSWPGLFRMGRPLDLQRRRAAAAKIGRIEKLPLRVARHAMNQSFTDHGVLRKLGSERVQEGIATRGRDRARGVHHGGEFIVG